MINIKMSMKGGRLNSYLTLFLTCIHKFMHTGDQF